MNDWDWRCGSWCGFVLLGFVRPDHGVRSRPVWFAAHWLTGTGGVLLGFYNIYTGLHAYQLMHQKSLRMLNILFVIQLSLVAFVYLTQDRWQYLKNQGQLSKTVTPMYNDQKPNNGATAQTDDHHEAHIQIIPNALKNSKDPSYLLQSFS